MTKITKPSTALLNNLLQTKFDIPMAFDHAVVRSRLFDVLNSGKDKKVILVNAPTGYGKTTLISEWSRSLDQTTARIVWITLDQYDNNPAKFWLYFSYAFQRIQDGFRLNLDTISFRENETNYILIIHQIINEISRIPRQIYLVLDDFYWISNEKIFQEFSYFIEHQPQNLHLILLSRTIPALALVRLRAKNQMVEITTQNLAFTQSEITTFLSKRMGLSIDRALSKQLYQFTEGWIIGVQLIGLALQESNNFNQYIIQNPINNPQIFEYLTVEVLERLDLDLQRFLKQTSVFKVFSAALCDAVLNRNDSQQMIEKIEAANLFLKKLDEHATWFKYQSFFSDLLMEQLKTEAPASLNTLHKKAANWFCQNGYAENAVYHALKIEDLEFAADIFDSCTILAVKSFDTKNLYRWISLFPNDIFKIKPHLGLYIIQAKIEMGLYDQADNDIEKYLFLLDENTSHLNQEEIDTLRWNLASIRTSMDCIFRDPQNGIKTAEELCRNRPPNVTYFYGQMITCLAQAYAENGDLQSAVECLQISARTAQDEKVNPEYAFTRILLAYIYRLQGRLRDTEVVLKDFLDYCEKISLNSDAIPFFWMSLLNIAMDRYDLNKIDILKNIGLDNPSPVNNNIHPWLMEDLMLIQTARYHLIFNEIDRAIQYFEKAKNSYSEKYYCLPFISSELIELQINLWQRTDQLSSASDWLEEKISILNLSNHPNPTTALAWAKIYISQNKAERAIEILKELETKAIEQRSGHRLLKIYILSCMAYDQINHRQEAFRYLQSAIRFAQPEGYVYPFVLEGKLLQNRLEGFISDQTVLEEYPLSRAQITFALKIIECMNHQNSIQLKPDTPFDFQRDEDEEEQLSQREQTVMALLLQGNTPKEISAQLAISVNTTRTHIKNIYRKMNVHSRFSLRKAAIEKGLI